LTSSRGVDAATEYIEDHSTERFVFPAPAFEAVLVGEGNGPDDEGYATQPGDGRRERTGGH